MDKEIEIWKDIEGYEGLYQVSNFGNVKSLNYNRTGKEKILKSKKDKDGYLQFSLCKNGKVKHFKTHRLVALAFIPNLENLPQVNHKDENKENNHVDNLEWVSPKENINYGTRNKKVSEALKGKYIGENSWMFGKHLSEETKQKLKEYFSKPVLQYTKDKIFIREWESGKLASEELNINKSNITACCQGKQKTAGGFIWKYKE